MKVHLLHADRDTEWDVALPGDAETLEADLEVATLLDAMAAGDAFLRETARRGLLARPAEPAEIRYRQSVLADVLRQPPVARELYAHAVRGVETRRDSRFFWFRDSPDSIRQKSLGMLDRLLATLREVRLLAERHAADFDSEGFTRLFAMLRQELDDEYLAGVARQLDELGFGRGALLSAALGRGNRGARYTLRRPGQTRWRERLTPGASGLSFTVSERDESGMQTIADIRARGSARVADALGQATDGVLAFFATLRAELGFYIACLNLHDELAAHGVATTAPDPRPAAEGALTAKGLRDAALALHLPDPPVASDVNADRAELVIVAGANQGGKSTFLRSVGLAQVMMEAGMFVCADAYRASVTTGVHSHFKREEDATMTRGQLEDELERMSRVADRIRPGGLLLCNESFSATNEREGSEIAREVTRALTEAGVRVVFVTHLHDFASGLGDTGMAAIFLRAERCADGTRTFRILPGRPEPTSHGEDSYRRIFGAAPSPAPGGALGSAPRDEARVQPPLG